MQKQCIDGERVFTIPEFFTLDECASAIARSERAGYAEATITSPVGVVMDKSIRDNARLIVDDSALAATLWQRLQPFLPASIDQWRLQGLNERFRFYRYDPGQRFAPHLDGYFERANGDRSHLTFMIYLNDDFAGGETRFYSGDTTQPRATVRAERGMALVFAHLQLHEGAAVVSGRKYVLRTDVMYTQSVERSS